MHSITMTREAWQGIKARLDLDESKFEESTKDAMTVVVFKSVCDCEDTLKKMKQFNVEFSKEVAGIKEAYNKMQANNVK